MATDNTQPTEKKKFSRRRFLKRGAIILGGTVVATYLARSPIRRFSAGFTEGLDFPSIITDYQPDFWFSVLPDNSILMKSPKIEMGQGILTGFAMLAAEELEMPVERIKVEHFNTGSGVQDLLGTGGSNSSLGLYKPIREVAATMREMLKLAAAKKWGVDVKNVSVTEGVISAGEKRITYAEIVAETTEWKVPKTPTLKPESAFKYVGKSIKRIDLTPKVMGTAAYTIDKKLPAMLHAVKVETPYLGGTIQSFDPTEAEKSADVIKVVRQEEFVAVVAKSRFAALKATEKLKIEWNVPKKWQQSDIETIVTVGNGNEVSVQSKGNANSILAKTDGRVFKQEYRTPMAANAPMEPRAAVGHVVGDKATITVNTQSPATVNFQASNALDLKMKNVDIQIPYLGGGFGGKMMKHNGSEAALLSKIVGKPVKLVSSREEEFQNSLMRPNTHHVLQAKISKNGTIEALTHAQATADMVLKNYLQGAKVGLNLAGADFIAAGHGSPIYYDGIKNIEVSLWNATVPYQVGIWRGVGMVSNTFAIESFINELAHELKKDPIALRIELFSGKGTLNPRFIKVLEALRDQSGWTTPKATGIGRGIAVANDRKSIAGTMVEVALEDGQIRVKKAVQILDAGKAINPEGIRQQMEGCLMMGISAALYEEILVKDGQIATTNYHEYPMVTLADTPSVECHILQNTDEVYGVGEPPIAPVAPAIAAAIFDLTGQRLRKMPFKLMANG